MTISLSDDAAIHAAALAYNREHRVGYSIALTAVIDKARNEAAATTQAKTPASSTASDSDIELDRKAKAHARQTGVSYSEALSHVVTGFTLPQQNFAEAGSDADIHGKAVVYARSHDVSYSEALDHVARTLTSSYQNFAEGQTQSPLEKQSIEIFKAGRHIADDGQSIEFSLADLQATADGYDPSVHEAPLTIGHPAQDKPAYGWVTGLQATADGRLLMDVRQVDADFAEMVKAGRYKKRSASFYAPSNPKNPKPGIWYLRHVGWLGAQPPAVKGLAEANFSAQPNGDSYMAWLNFPF